MGEQPRSLNALTIGGVIVAAFLFVTFLFASFSVMLTANDPPLLADPAPTVPPVLLCPPNAPSSEARATGGATTGGESSASSSEATQSAGDPSAGTPPATETSPVPDASSPPVGSNVVVTCAPEQVAFTPQYRGGYDPNTRLMALLAVVVPLLTTIVAFYFGQRAGAGAGEAEKQKVLAQVMATDPQGRSQTMTDLKEQLGRANKI